jgi:sugar O-acyltransferase (sialic acid O-acetyltransferase NeuD family)
MLLAILGAGGHGRVIAESAVSSGWTVNFFDDALVGQVDGLPVAGKAADVIDARVDGAIVAIGDNRIRLAWIGRLRASGVRIVTVADPSSQVSITARIGDGSFIARGAIVSTGAILGSGCIINTAATVDHDCRLGDGVHISPGAHLSGAVQIGEASWLGTACAVRNNITIGSDVIVGVGGVVVNNVGNGQTVVGVPARPMEKL